MGSFISVTLESFKPSQNRQPGILSCTSLVRTSFINRSFAFNLPAILEAHAIQSILMYLRLPDKPPELAVARISEQAQSRAGQILCAWRTERSCFQALV